MTKKYRMITDAIDAVNEGRDVPRRIGEFTLAWKSTDGWRGYYSVTASRVSKWERIDSDWMTGDWEDAGDHAGSSVEKKLDALADQLEAEGFEMAVFCAPTSNVFSTGYDVFKRARIID